MPDFSTPSSIGDAVEDTARQLFGDGLDDPILALKCRFHYAQAKVEAQQHQGEVSEALMDRLHKIEEKLMDRGIRPSTLIKAQTKSKQTA